SIDQQAQNNANGTPANPYRTMYGWDGSPGATNSSQIGTPSTFFDNLLKTSSGTRVPLVADFTGNRTPYRVLIEATYGTGQNPVSFGARNGERNPLAEHNFSLNHVKSLLNEAIMSFKESALKMARAFPTFKLYFLQENSQSPSHFVSFDDFYSYSSVKEIRITRHRKIPAGLCMIRLTNLSGILSNASYWNRANNPNMIFANGRGEDNGGIPSGNLQVYNPFRHDLGDDARHENAFDALLLK
ncbi:hypothetical protein LRR18_16395, partial [Mangrovimonas sp. AS39]|uniref:hypothetical protein n=1 Tax=Mangrovimonas futianensis TaxID=2895523 RepID=UPI001E318333